MSRLAKTKDVLRLAFMMSGSQEGVSLADIADEFGVDRRTAERMRDVILDVFPADDVHVSTGDDRVKRWKLRSGNRNRLSIDDLTSFSSDEVSVLETAARVMEKEGMATGAESILAVRDKLRSLMRPERLRRIDPDVEALSEAEGLALRPGPRQIINEGVMSALRDAILMNRKVILHYKSRSTGLESRQPVCPYGFLYGNRHYLVAHNENEQSSGIRTFVLANIKKVDIRDESFEKPNDFSLKAYASRMFGVFDEEPFDVVLRFSPDAAEDARQFMFHPTQMMEDEPDGSVIVRFHAGGAREMVWHLFTWGDSVEILAPSHLQELMDEWCGWGEEG